jgi:hypothetical protein
LEENASQKGFELKDGKIPILLALKKIEDLKPHEETVPSDLQGIIKTLDKDPILRHPVIADAATGAVLDGTHRLAALSQMGCYMIPAALIEYQNPLVRVDRWFRTISGERLETFRKKLEELEPFYTSPLEADRALIERSIYASLQDGEQCLGFKSRNSGLLQLAKSAFRIEQIARNNSLKIAYRDNVDLKGSQDSSFVMSTIKIVKAEVLESCLNHVLFPPKTTRHIIPSRPLGIGVPLTWLRDTKVGQAEAAFLQHLRSKSVRQLPEGSWVGSRRYLEEVFLFE